MCASIFVKKMDFSCKNCYVNFCQCKMLLKLEEIVLSANGKKIKVLKKSFRGTLGSCWQLCSKNNFKKFVSTIPKVVALFK